MSDAFPAASEGRVIASVIIPAYRAGATLVDCVASVLDQVDVDDYEVIVAASADDAADLPEIAADPRLTVLTHVPRWPAAVARNHAARLARGEVLAFTDADVLVDRNWLAQLTDATMATGAAAGGVRNGTPESRAGTVEYLTEFLDLHPRRPPRTAWHGATCNLGVRRDVWERFGPFPEDLDGGEDTVLTVALRQQGLFRFDGNAVVTHRNRTSWPVVLQHQYDIGAFTARLARRSPYKWRTLVTRWWLAPVAAAGRVVSVYARVAAWTPGELPRALLLLPRVATALAWWGRGLLAEGARLDRRRRT